MPLSVGGRSFSSFHFAGILGSGMSAIAQFLAWSGLRITGSDRLASSEEMNESREKLERCGCVLFPQDGSGVTAAAEALVVSTAIEESNPDVAAARAAGVGIFHRSDVLAAVVAGHRTIAVCGTSGKSTVAAMAFEILRGAGKSPSLIGGANLIRLGREGLLGNAFKGNSGTLLIEADESDGTLVKYRPEKAVFLNVSKDHQPVAETLKMFQQLSSRTAWAVKNADDPGLAPVAAAHTFGLSNGADCTPDAVLALAPAVRFAFRGTDFDLPFPGRHNLSNALAALCICASEGCRPEEMAGPLRGFEGILRRFSVRRTAGGLPVIDDYAHNPEKIRAALLTAREFGARLFAVFQPHGYGPARFLREELTEVFSRCLRPGDEVYFLPIYYAGGTVKRDISSEDLAGAVRRNGAASRAVETRGSLIGALQERVRPGDAVILMGARDPTLSSLAEEIRRSLE